MKILEYEVNLSGDVCFCDSKKDIFVDIYTKENYGMRYLIHGMESKIGYSLEVKLNLHPSEISRLIPEIVDNIIDRKIEIYDGLVTSELTGNPVEIIITKPNVARIVFSDEKGLLPNDPECDKNFINQYMIEG